MRKRREHLPIAVMLIAIAVPALAPNDVAAASCGGQSHALELSNGRASPATGSPDTLFTFSVRYTDNNACSPDRIVVVVEGFREYRLDHLSGDLKDGATFRRTVNLPAGTWTYRFEAESGTGVGRRTAVLSDVDPAVLEVRAPISKPTSPPPAGTPVPTAAPTEAPTSPPSAPPTMTPAPDPSPAAAPGQTPKGPASPTASGAVPSGTIMPGAGSGAAATSGPAAAAGTDGAAGTRDGESQPALGGQDLAGFLPSDLPRPIVALGVAGVGTLIGLLFFVIVGRRWLDTQPAWSPAGDADPPAHGLRSRGDR